MNIGILIYSQTGNTLSVAERLRDRLTAGGHTAAIERVTVQGDAKPGTSAILDNRPDPSGYDFVVFAAPVQAFGLAMAMKTYLGQVEGITGKPVALFVTKQLKQRWLGGNKALSQMGALCSAKGASVGGTGMVCWSHPDREGQITGLTESLAAEISRH